MTNPRNTSTESRRIVLIRNAASYDFGGAERFVVHLAQELKKSGWEPTIVSAHKGIEEYAQQEGIAFEKGPWLQSWQDWSGWRIGLFPLFVLWQLMLIAWYVRLCKRLRPAVIHPQSRDDFIAATIAGTLRGVRVVWTDHADLKYVYQNVSTPIKNPVGKWVWRTSRKAHAVTLVSKSEQQLISRAVGITELPDNYQVIYNGVLDTSITPVKRALGEQDAVIYCATSRLVIAKGIGELIDAFKEVDQRFPARLWIVGDGPDVAQFKAQAGNNPHIIFKGFQPDALPYVASADVFVHPSYHEGFSLSIVEAAMLGKPMVACDVGGNPEIVQEGENGLLVPPKDAKTLAQAMTTLGKDISLRERYGKAARQTYKRQFEFDTIVQERFVPLYEE